MLSAPGASLGCPDSACSLPRGGEIVQMACREPEPRAREDVMRSRVRTPANVCIRFARTGRLQALLGSSGALLGPSWALLGPPGALLGSEMVQMACRKPEPRAREDVMGSRVRTPATFFLLKASQNQWKWLLSTSRACPERPDSVCSLTHHARSNEARDRKHENTKQETRNTTRPNYLPLQIA